MPRKPKPKGIAKAKSVAKTSTHIVYQRLLKETAELTEVRNKLRAIAEDAEELADNADEALGHLNEAAEILSRYV